MGETAAVCRTADDVKACLSLRWPDSEYLSIYEAPEDSSRSGRKLDVVVLSLWRSRGLAMDGVEIKVSASDWTRELKNAEKADWWWSHVNRFWVAVPEALAERVVSEAPGPWGVLACTPGAKPRVAKKAPHHDAKPMPWTACVGMMRAAADCGVNALQRAEHRGYLRGKEAAEKQGEKYDRRDYLREDNQRMKANIAAFEKAAGVKLHEWDQTPEQVGAAVRVVLGGMKVPGSLARTVERTACELEDAAKKAREAADATAKATDHLTAHEAA